MKKRYFSCNSDSFTDEHNVIMDRLLCCYEENTDENIAWDYDNCCYYPTSEEGLKILEYLRDCDLIEEVTNND